MPKSRELSVTLPEVTPADTVVSASQKVIALNIQAQALRAEIKQLQRTLRNMQMAYNNERTDQLLRANERLVIATLDAQAIAEAVTQDLLKLTRTGQRDPLTDTPNRALMEDRLKSAISLAQRNNHRVALLFMDLDGFKAINDTLGHATGDAVLQHVAQILQVAVRDSDAVGRHGGDEFLVLLGEVFELTDIASIASKILQDIGSPCIANGHALTLSASLGIAVYPDHSLEGRALISLADAAMYASKRRGGNCFSFHDDVHNSMN